MGNTLGTTNGALIAQQALATLFAMFPALRQITTDFSDKGGKLNQTVNSRVIIPTTAIPFVAANGYVETDQVAVDVPVLIDTHIHATYAVTDLEASSTDLNLVAQFAAAQAHALGKKLMDLLFAFITAARFAQSYNVTPANFDRDDFVKLRTKLNKLNVPDLNRFSILNSDYYEGPSLDSTIVANAGSGADTVKSGRVPPVHGFEVSEYSSLPDNAENLAGIAGNKEALIIATRLPEQPSSSTPIPGIITSVTEPNSGLTVQQRAYYDMKLAKEVRSLTLLVGIGSGLTNTAENNRLVRIVNA
jgi:hypothetical protein